MKPLVFRAVARRDVEAVIDYYRREAGEEVVLGFVDSFEKTCHSIGRRPASGSPHLGNALDLSGVRSKPLVKFPYLIFYVELPKNVEVWRVLHTRRDIPASLIKSSG